MKYVVSLNGERVAVTREGDTVALDSTTATTRVSEVAGTPIHLVTIGDEVHRVVVQRRLGRGAYVLWIDGFRYEVEALDERERAIRDLTAAAATPAGPAPLVAPMPGLIVRVKVRVGDTVQAGQGLVVMEAMKMENELRAAAPGRVKAIAVAPGTAVEKGARLVELE